MYIGDNKLVITIEDKTFQSDLPKNVGINLKYEVLALHTIKHDIRELLSKYEQGNEKKTWTQKTVELMNHTNLFLTCCQLDLISSNKHVALQHVSI